MNLLDYMKKADFAIASVNHLLAIGDMDGAANRAYYAVLHAARAALLSVGESATGRHGTIIRRFSLQFVKNGPLSVELGKTMAEAQRLRSVGDYESEPLDPDAVAADVAKASEFVIAVRGLIPSFNPEK